MASLLSLSLSLTGVSLLGLGCSRLLKILSLPRRLPPQFCSRRKIRTSRCVLHRHIYKNHVSLTVPTLSCFWEWCKKNCFCRIKLCLFFPIMQCKCHCVQQFWDSDEYVIEEFTFTQNDSLMPFGIKYYHCQVWENEQIILTKIFKSSHLERLCIKADLQPAKSSPCLPSRRPVSPSCFLALANIECIVTIHSW